MGNAVFPVLPGLAWSVTKTPMWSTRIQPKVSGRENRAAYYSLPLWTFSLSYEFLRANAKQELQQLVGFFNARQGRFDSFLYADPSDCAATGQLFGSGNGNTSKFQLVRSLGGFAEPVIALPGGLQVFVNGVLQPAVTVDASTGIVTFAAAPAAGAALTWTGQFYFRCRFVHDSTEFENFMKDLWTAKKVELVSVK